jgi:hypothetical protein
MKIPMLLRPGSRWQPVFGHSGCLGNDDRDEDPTNRDYRDVLKSKKNRRWILNSMSASVLRRWDKGEERLSPSVATLTLHHVTTRSTRRQVQPSTSRRLIHAEAACTRVQNLIPIFEERSHGPFNFLNKL